MLPAGFPISHANVEMILTPDCAENSTEPKRSGVSQKYLELQDVNSVLA